MKKFDVGNSITIISCLIACLFIAQILANDYYYTDKIYGKKYVYTPKLDEIAVRFVPGIGRSEIEDLAFQHRLSLRDKRSNSLKYFIFKIPSHISYDEIEHQLLQSRIVSSVIPVFISREGKEIHIAPETFTIQFMEDISTKTAEEILNLWGCKIEQDHWTPGYYTVTVPIGMTVFEAVREFMKYPEVRFTEPDYYGFNDLNDDTYLYDAWHLRNTGQYPGYTVDSDIKAFPAWNITYGDPDVIIIVLDTGIDLTHPDLDDNILPRENEDWNFTTASGDEPIDEEGHGTNVSGIVAAEMNEIGMRGVAPLCRIMPLKIFITGRDEPISWRVDGINYAVSRSNDFTRVVINCSWGTNDDFPSVHQAIQNAVNNDIPTIFSTGNSDIPYIGYPAKYPETIAVGAMAPCDNLRKHTSTCDGEWWWGSNWGPEIDIAAPGVQIYTTDIQGEPGKNPDSQYPNNLLDWDYNRYFHGTSSAAPMVAGVAALMLSVNPYLTESQLRMMLHDAADKVGPYNYNWDPLRPGHSKDLGYGRLDAHEAVLAASDVTLRLAEENKSLTNTATYSNSARHLLRG
ncbi:MAG: S8 family serine peptidase, partial [Aliifodinibius sp.]|nr:S8 family serine peptidase [candidate division Zixibacteria bacterium]NIT61412.1 S8 family serine peptidase [Fodinibius sp.]NIW49897.1 S8 family serine peptidase [Gammaproteobacteria bacterium]NIS45920.1 S8 family serine peptidase [candidate division Zixibacteria bacterium]NIU14057.1 S8 family serine peptidase [candidate division Zixibacteria bacterium]